eukprot:PhM_4_TR2220/c0_g1_i1/m.25704/K16599/TTLL1; tubulin polyglutamylase TTLL1
MSDPVVKYKTEFEKVALTSNFERLGWTRVDGDDWNFYWASVTTARNIFHPDSNVRLTDNKIINHFPNHYELTRKDYMTKNIKRYKKDKDREREMGQLAMQSTTGDSASSKRTSSTNALSQTSSVGGHAEVTPSLNAFGETLSDFVPLTYSLPSDFAIFSEEFKKHNCMWIVKPANKSQGNGIFLVSKLSQITRWNKQRNQQANDGTDNSNSNNTPFIVCKYIDNPLLIGEKKFDIRMYVLVTSYRPLRAYLHEDAFARFCTAKYSSDVSEIENLFAHLTNVAVQKHGDEYNEVHGGKWHIRNLRLFVESQYGHAAMKRLFDNINFVIVQSLKAVQNMMNNDKHCFELYGYDLLIDTDLRPWLIEINASPSLTVTTQNDKLLKQDVIRDTLGVVIPPNFPLGPRTYKDHRLAKDVPLGGFSVLVDEVPPS